MPLNVAPWGSTYCNWFDDAERVKAGTVVANAATAINDVKSRTANVVEISNLVFFIFPTDRCLREVKADVNKNGVEKKKNSFHAINAS